MDVVVQGKSIPVFTQTEQKIGAIRNFEIGAINNKSASLIASHNGSWGDAKHLKQNQYLETFPVHEISYEIENGKKAPVAGKFWIFGENKMVNFDDYPAQCCCCCNMPQCFNNCSDMNSCTIL